MIGQVIGNYRVERKLGEGGMGAVFEAVHQQLGRRAAIKVLHQQLSRDPQVAARFFQEAKAVNVIDHPGLVDIYEFGHMPDGTAYIIMEYLKGESLSGRLQRAGGRLSDTDTVRISRQVASALSAAHGKNIVHRDLKPDNVMLVPDPDAPGGERAKVLDFGIAKIADAHGESTGDVKTRTGMMLGTPVYMSPEQCRGAAGVDDRSDVYSLGVMAYHMLSGAPPFMAPGLGDLLIKHIMEQPRPLTEVAPLVHPGLANLIHGMLAKAPAQRPSMAQVVGELTQLGQAVGLGQSALGTYPRPAAQLGSLGATPVNAYPSTLGQAAGQVPSMLQSLQGVTTGSNRGLLFAVAGLALLLLGGGGVFLAMRPKTPTAQLPLGQETGQHQIGQHQIGQPTFLDDPPDVHNLDVSDFLKRARQVARKRLPDAELNTIVAMCVKPDGIADLKLCQGVVLYKFRSPEKSLRGDTPIGVRLPCLVQVVVQEQMGMVAQIDSSDKCDESVLPKGQVTPRCTAKQAWKRAIEKGLPKNAIANPMVYLDKQWFITVGGESRYFPDDC